MDIKNWNLNIKQNFVKLIEDFQYKNKGILVRINIKKQNIINYLVVRVNIKVTNSGERLITNNDYLIIILQFI